MFKSFSTFATVAAALLICGTSQAQWVDYESMIKAALERQNQIVRDAESNVGSIIQHHMQDPRMQQMYEAYVAQGGTANFQQYCYWYTATAGGTNVRGYIDSERGIRSRESKAVNAYHAHVDDLWNRTGEERRNVYDRIARDRGDIITGSTNYYDPNTGTTTYLPYTPSAGTTVTDGYGNSYTMDPSGQYNYTPNHGYSSNMYPVWNQ